MWMPSVLSKPETSAYAIVATMLATVATLWASPVRSSPILDAPQYKSLKAAWSEVQKDLAKGAWEEAASKTHHLSEIRLDLGLPNAYVLSAALLKAAYQAVDAGQPTAAIRLASAASSLSPDMALASFELASLNFASEPFGVGEQLKALRTGFESLSGDLGTSFAALANTSSALIYAVTLVLFFLAIALLARYWLPLSHDLGRLVPLGETPLNGGVLLLGVLAAPLVFGAGLLVSLVLGTVLASLYMGLLERIVAILVIVALSAFPYLTDATKRGLVYPGSHEALIERCNNSLCGPEDRAELARVARDSEYAFEGHYTLALVEKRARAADNGPYEAAFDHLNKALRISDRPEGQVLLGQLLYLKSLRLCDRVVREDISAKKAFDKSMLDALDSFERAAGAAPQSLPANYNAMVVHRQLGHVNDAAEYEARVHKLAPHKAKAQTRNVSRGANESLCQMSKLGNRHLLEARLSAQELRDRLMHEELESSQLLVPFSNFLGGQFDPDTLGRIALGAATTIFLLLFLASALPLSRHCCTCHCVARPNTSARKENGDLVCRDCVKAEIHRGISDAKETWDRDQHIQGLAFRRARIQRWLTWLFPGAGHLLRGAPVRGILFAGLVFGSLIVAFGLHRIVADPRQPAGIGAGRTFFFCGVAALAYLVAVFDAHASPRKRSKPSNGPSS